MILSIYFMELICFWGDVTDTLTETYSLLDPENVDTYNQSQYIHTV